MHTSPVIRRLLQQISLPVVCLMAMAYFAHHALLSEHGAGWLLQAKDEIAQKSRVLEAVQAERAALEARVRALYPKRVDPDLLDERARETLGLARPDEIVIFKQK